MLGGRSGIGRGVRRFLYRVRKNGVWLRVIEIGRKRCGGFGVFFRYIFNRIY